MKLDTALKRGIAVAIVHVLLVSTLAAKFIYDRQTRPRVWVRTASYDPYLPIRGRYVSLMAEVQVEQVSLSEQEKERRYSRQGDLEVREGKLWIKEREEGGEYRFISIPRWMDNNANATEVFVLSEQVLFFIPETVKDPSRLQAGQELWVELTVPKKGPPRPIQLALKHQDGKWEPLGLD